MPNFGRNVGSDASASQRKDAIKTSMGTRARLGTTRKASPAFNGPGPPSTAGLDNAKSAWVQPKSSGYPTTHVRGGRLPQNLSTNFGSLGTSSISPRMVDYTHGGSGNSSVARMNKRMKFDRMF